MRPYRHPGRLLRLGLVILAWLALIAGLAAALWWSWNADEPLVHDREEPRSSRTPTTAASLPRQPAPDPVADIAEPINTTAIMKFPCCASSYLDAALDSRADTYPGTDVRLKLTVTADKETPGWMPCRLDDGRTATVLTIRPQGEKSAVWKSSQCTSRHSGPRWLQLIRNNTVTVDFTWKRRTLDPDCSPAQPVPHGTYVARALLLEEDRAGATFTLTGASRSEQPAEQPSPLPTPRRPASAPESTDSGTAGLVGGLLDDGTAGEEGPSQGASSTSDPTSGANGSSGNTNSSGGFSADRPVDPLSYRDSPSSQGNGLLAEINSPLEILERLITSPSQRRRCAYVRPPARGPNARVDRGTPRRVELQPRLRPRGPVGRVVRAGHA